MDSKTFEMLMEQQFDICREVLSASTICCCSMRW